MGLQTACSTLPWARVFAAIVPALNGVRLLAVGTGVVRDEGLVASVSRSGVSTLDGYTVNHVLGLHHMDCCGRGNPHLLCND